MNKLLKYTSLLFLGFLMLTTPERNAFAANEKVETETDTFAKTKMTDGLNYAEGQRLKASVAKYTAERNKIKDALVKAKTEFKDMHGKGRSICIRAFKARIVALTKESSSELRQQLESVIDNLLSDKGAWDKFTATVSGVASLGTSFIKGHLKAEWEVIKSTAGFVIDEAMNLANTFFKEKDLHLSAVFQAQNMAEKCHYENISSADSNYFAELQKKAQEVDNLAGQIASMPENVDEKNLYVYQVYAGQDENGNPIYKNFYALMSEDGTLKSLNGVTQGCMPLPAKLAESRSCLICPLFKTIFNAANNMASNAYRALGLPLAKVILVGFALLIAFKVMSNVSAFTKQDAPRFITELLVNIFKVLVAFYMLKNSFVVYNYIIGPVLKAGFEFGSSLLFSKGTSYLTSCKNSLDGVQVGIMPSYLYSNLDCFIKAVQAEVAVPQSIGSSLMCVARNAGKTNLGPVRNLLWDFGMFFQGLVIWIMGWIMALAFAFYLIDATIQLGILGALMPFLIACWPFKITQSYTKKGWEIFMNTFFVYVFMGLVVSINVELLGQALTGSKGGFTEVMRALNGNEIKQLKDLLDIGFAGMLVLIACCLFAWKLTGKATDLAGSMAGGFNLGIGNKIGGLAANVATKATQGTAKLGLKAAGAAGELSGVTPLLRKGRDKVADWALRKTIRRRSAAVVGAGAGATATTRAAGAGTPPPLTPTPTSSEDILAENQIKKISQSGSRQQSPVTPHSETPGSGGRAGDTEQSHSNANTPQADEQLRQQLENDYNNTENGKAGQQMIQNQTAEVTNKKRAETEAQGKMNYHNKRAEEYLRKAEGAGDIAQKQKFEELANQQFEEAVKAEALYNQAKADTQRAQEELNSIQQENDRYKEEYIQTEMKKRSSGSSGGNRR